jgi:diacylglycerol kinase
MFTARKTCLATKQVVFMAVVFWLLTLQRLLMSNIEEMVDLIVKEHREQARIAKDVAAGMVLVAAIGSVIIGAVIFLPYIFNLLG